MVSTGSGTKDEGMASVTQIVKVKFVESKQKGLSLYVKTLSPNPNHTEFIDDIRAFEKEIPGRLLVSSKGILYTQRVQKIFCKIANYVSV